MNKTIKKYYDLANDYHLSATIMWQQLVSAPYIFNPTIYLLRHTIELLLKGLIIKEKLQIDTSTNIANIVIQENNRAKNLNSVHSLFVLWKNYKNIHSGNHIVHFYTDQEAKFIDKTIKSIDNRDYNSTAFRYPYSKQGKSIIIEPLDVYDADVINELKPVAPTIIQYANGVYVIKKGIRCIAQAQKLFDVAELLFRFFGK